MRDDLGDQIPELLVRGDDVGFPLQDERMVKRSAPRTATLAADGGMFLRSLLAAVVHGVGLTRRGRRHRR